MIIRASSLDLAAICPGVLEFTDRPTDPTYTSVGTVGHRMLQLAVEEDLAAAGRYLDGVLAGHPGRHVLAALRGVIADLWAWLPSSGIAPVLTRAEATAREAQLWTEAAFDLWLTPEVTVRGHVDFAVLFDAGLDVTDWKFYHQTALSMPIERSLQLLAYGLAIYRTIDQRVSEVRIHRVNAYTRRKDSVVLTTEMVGEVETILAEIGASILSGAGQRRVGAQCLSCLWSRHCPERNGLVATIGAPELAPYRGGQIASDAEALRFLIAKPALEDLLKQGEEAVKEYVASKGRPLVDIMSNRQWGPIPTAGKREVVDAAELLNDLAEEVGANGAREAVHTTIAALERVLTDAGWSPKERAHFLEQACKRGRIKKGVPGKMFRWSQIRRSRDAD